MYLVNRVELFGRIGNDLEVKEANGGTKVLEFSLATNESVKTKEGREDRTEWHRMVAFGKTAENLARLCSKGGRIAVTGSLRSNRWEGEDGKTRKTVSIFVREFLALDMNAQKAKGDDIPY